MATSEATPPVNPPQTKPIFPPQPPVPVKNIKAKTDASTVEAERVQEGLPEDGDEQFSPGSAYQHAGGFFNQPWVQNVLPLATSLALHVGLITIGVLFFLGYEQVVKAVSREQTIVPESKAIDKNAQPGGIEHPGPLNDPTRDFKQDQTKDTDDSGFTTNSKNKTADLEGGSTSDDAESSSALGLTAARGKGSNGAGGSGDAFGSGTGGGGAAFGVPGGGGGLGPKAKFFGMGGNARKIVYLCDASGSMMSVFSTLRQQLKSSITPLSVQYGQEFNIIVFNDANCMPLFKDSRGHGEMRMATADNIKAAMEWIDNQIAAGPTQPMLAINDALEEKPELLYVLTDGFDNVANFDDVTNAFKKGNPDGKIHVKCIFLESDPDPKLEETLKKVATNPSDFVKIKKSDM